jgi:ParB/RepB/Spo0J family partition protein
MELDLHQLDRPYERLRITTRSSMSRLLASLAAEGQQTPVLVVGKGEGRYALIDGYQRAEALEKLGRDTVEAVVLDLDESSALIFRHRQQRAGRSSALEDAWLLRALTEQHGLDQHELARRLGHHQSWVSRRLGLLTTLPNSVQELVRKGRLSSHLAGKYLVPMARAISSDCEKLAEKIADHQVTTRQMEKLYVAWKSNDDQGRARLVDAPMLFVRAAGEMEQSEPPHPDAALIKDVEVLGALCRRLSRRLSRRPRDLALPDELCQLWPATRRSFDTLATEMKEKAND